MRHSDRSSTGSDTPPAAPTEDKPRDGGRFSPRNWRVATRLNAILLLPVLVALGLAGLRVHDHHAVWQEADRAASVAELVHASTAYAHALIDERDLTAEPLLAGDDSDPVVERARQATDEARATFESRAADTPTDESLQRRLDSVHEVAPRLDSLRAVAYTDELPGAATHLGYVEIQHPVMSFTNELVPGAGDLASYGRSVYAVSLGKAALSLQRSLGTHLLVDEDASDEEVAELARTVNSYVELERIARTEYVTAASAEEVDLLDTSLAAASGTSPDTTDPVTEMVPALVAGQSDPDAPRDSGITVDAWFDAATDRFDGYREVEVSLVDDAVEEAQGVSAEARTDMLTSSVLVVALLVAAFLLAGLMARSMSTSMRRLRDAALQVAEDRLPAMVRQLSRTDPGRVDTEVAALPVAGRGEIGEVSRAFDRVHREAVRLAAEQAMQRGNVNAILTNLSGRTQGLIERQLALISELENNEADPEQLDHLFRLDHLATRMRRNGENLLVLAGEEAGRRWDRPLPLVDVVRAAASEVEDYPRIEITGVPAGDIHGAVVTDLVHLLAELLENATAFSSPHTAVRVSGTRLSDGRIMVEIQDQGIGLTAEDFADINRRLAEPPAVDADVSRRMGLYVVGRLALRHGVRVQLRPAGDLAGTTSLVMLPVTVLGDGGDPARVHDQSGTRHVPHAPERSVTAPRHATPAGGRPTSPEGGAPGSGGHVVPGNGGVSDTSDAGHPSAHAGYAEPFHADPSYPGDSHAQLRYAGSASEVGGTALPTDRPSRVAPGTETATPALPGWPASVPDGPGSAAAPAPAAPDARPPFEPNPSPFQEPGDGDDLTTGYAAPGQKSNSYAGGLSGPSGFEGVWWESGVAPQGPPPGPQRVGCDDAGLPAGSGADHAAPGEGLPRRDAPRPDGGQRARWPSEQAPQEAQWERGPRRDAVETSGVTASGLPRRVPRTDPAEHAPVTPPAGGPQVSRAPEDIRGRLADLRRGVREGRGAGRWENDHEGYGPGNDQER